MFKMLDNTRKMRIRCDCSEHEIEIYYFKEIEPNWINLYIKFWTNLANNRINYWQRLKIAYQVLTHGRYQTSDELMLTNIQNGKKIAEFITEWANNCPEDQWTNK
jgi:hypothetical protein